MPLSCTEKISDCPVESQGDIGKRLFGSSVRARRSQLKINQAELAHRAGLHRTYVSDIERGERNVSLENILRLAAALQISVAALFEEAFPREAPTFQELGQPATTVGVESFR
jgi:transcriptional regulator with XRE-family HTH domain